MVLYGITLVSLVKYLGAVDLELLYPFYTDDQAFNGLARLSAQLLKLLMKRLSDQRYFPQLAKFIFILDTPCQEEAEKRDFAVEGLILNFFSGSWYLGAYLGPQEKLESWVKPQVESWVHGVKVLGK